MKQKLRTECLRVGMLQTNCYIVRRDGIGEEAVVIDPGDWGGLIADRLKELGVTSAVVLLTHAHYDHIMGLNELIARFPAAAVCIAEAERTMVEDARYNSGFYSGEYSIRPDTWLKEGDELSLIGGTVKVLQTPGHTKGSVCYYFPDDDVLFAGDTLFYSGCGRTDLPTGSQAEMEDSLERLLTTLPEHTAVYPGHGPETTIGREKMIEGY